MDAHEKIITSIKNLINRWNSLCNLPPNVALFGYIVDKLIQEEKDIHVDLEATQAVRKLAPNTIVVVEVESDLYYVNMERNGDIDIYEYFAADCDIQLISDVEALVYYDEMDPCRITESDLKTLRWVLHDGSMQYDIDDIFKIHDDKEEARKKRFEEQRTVSFDLPDEFLLLCEQFDLTPIQALRGFIGDVTGIINYVKHPTIPPRTDGYNSHGSDERDLAEQYWTRTHWSPDVEK
jgi:hypothetical protein